MKYRIEYPEDWIGIPDVGEGLEFETARAWSDAVAQHIVSAGGWFSRKKDRRAFLSDTLTVIAEGLAEEGAHAGYVWPETLDGPFRFVAVYGFDRAELGEATAVELAGGTDRSDYVPPIVRDAVSASGATGVYVERHAPLDDDAVHVATITGTYVFERPDSVVLLQAATTDLAAFERFRPRFEAFAATFRWDDEPAP